MRVREMAMTEADFRGVAECRVGGWRYAYTGLLPQPYLDAMDVGAEVAEWREQAARGGSPHIQLVAEDADGSIAGWAALGEPRDEDAGPGDTELFTLYARPDRIGSGVGRALTAEAVARARARTAPGGQPRRLLVWVLGSNARGRAFYERTGFVLDGDGRDLELGGVTVRDVRYRLPLDG